jgi:hypothetical protein
VGGNMAAVVTLMAKAKGVLHDQGQAYARKLDAAGVTVVDSRYNGMIHDFGLLNVLSDVPTTRAALIPARGYQKRKSIAVSSATSFGMLCPLMPAGLADSAQCV